MSDYFLDPDGVEAVKIYIDEKDTDLQEQIDALGEPFRLMDFSQTLSITIPSVTQDISNTSIPNVDVVITGTVADDFAIASLAKYEVYDAASGGNRLNVFPVCMFSMNGQKTLRVRMMCAGPSSKAAKRIQGAILLKHR